MVVVRVQGEEVPVVLILVKTQLGDEGPFEFFMFGSGDATSRVLHIRTPTEIRQSSRSHSVTLTSVTHQFMSNHETLSSFKSGIVEYHRMHRIYSPVVLVLVAAH